MSDCSALVFTAAVTNHPMWSPALMKSRSFARESATHENTSFGDSALGGAESLGPGGPPAVPSSCDYGLRGAIFLLRDSAEVEPEAAMADFLAPNRSGAFAWLGESLAPPTLRGLGTLGAIFIESGLGDTSL
jgi:hypothetical protein